MKSGSFIYCQKILSIVNEIRRQLMKIIATAAIIFLSTSVASKTLYQAKIWVAQNNTQIRVKSEIYPSMNSCSNNLLERSDFFKRKGYKAISSDTGSYKGFIHSSYFAKFGKNNLMLTCTTLP
jgi:hypothetical protein